jgi:tetratricopeptide (TPR) repeat protein
VQADYGQNIPAGVTVRLETNEGMIGGQQAVNTSGYFEFVGLAKTYYRLTVTASGFQTYQQDLDLRSVGDRFVVNVRLSPALESKPLPLPASPSFTDNNASKKARKEYEKGARALHDRNLAEAQSHLARAVEEYPCYARAQTDLALVLSQAHQLPGSEAALKKALECDPDYLDAYNELGQLYYNEEKYHASEAVLRQGLRRSPASWQFYYQLGASDYRLGQYRKAEQEYLKAESLSSSVPAEIHVKLADVYLKQSAYDKAYAEMQAYVRAEPDGRFAPKLKRVMRQMESDRIPQTAHPSSAQSPPPEP